VTLTLRDTLSRSRIEVIPLVPGTVRMYTCGPTVYRHAHVGNLRSYLLADLIRRVLLYHGLDVRHVKNITDVGHLRDDRFDRGEDRMLHQADIEGRAPGEIAAAYESAFHADEALMNILPAQVHPRATEHVPEMIELARRLVEAGHAYVTQEGNVYYAVSSFPGYGQLSGNDPDDLRAGHRGGVEPDKRDAADFALWKAAGPNRVLRWPSPWGEGSPGWHLECSAMALRHLGPRFDIHTGGVDNVFPHHEDEIAQSAPLVGGPPARIWVHGEHLLMSGRKMAKSSGNIERITDLAERGVDPLAFRYLALTVRYRHKLGYSRASIEAAARGLAALRARVGRLGQAPLDGPWAAPGAVDAEPRSDRAHGPTAPLSTAGRRLHDRFVAALDDDLDLPTALSVVHEIVRSDLARDERRWLALDADLVLGLDLGAATATQARASSAVPGEVAALIHDREAARAAGEYARSDAIRAEVGALGWELIDEPDGTRAVDRR
jgi:cysteinyl-tRNA synthetase